MTAITPLSMDARRCIICGGRIAKQYRLIAIDTETEEETELCVEWAHIECMFKLLEKAECRHGGRN